LGCPESDLLAAVREDGDRDAAAQLYLAHRQDAYVWARRYAGTQLADDLVAQAFTNVFAALLNGGGPTSGFAAYLRAAIRNAHIDHWRRTRRELSVADVPDTTVWADPAAADSGVDDEALQQALELLPPRWRQVVAWTLIEERPTAWVADRLGLSPNAAAALAYRARRSLREHYLQRLVA
jgi:RNA polymerase sigma factor (sigma-70 family)